MSKKLLWLRDLVFGNRYRLGPFRFSVPEDTPRTARIALFRQSYEGPERELLKNIPKGRDVVELGASFGIVSRFIRSRVGNDATIISVEAIPTLLSVCRENSGEADSSRFHLLNKAISYSGTPTVRFSVSDGIHDSRLAVGDQQAIEVEAITLAELCEQYIPDQPYSLVCDIEGAELELFEKDSAGLKNCHHAVVEFHPAVFAEAGKTEQDFFDLVEERGFAIERRISNVVLAVRQLSRGGGYA